MSTKKVIVWEESIYGTEKQPLLTHLTIDEGSFGTTADRFTIRYSKKHYCFIIFIIGYIFYIVIGSVIFQIIELPVERDLRNGIGQLKSDFQRKYPQITGTDLEDFLSEMIRAHGKGISPLGNVTDTLNWSIGQGIFFSSTVITTIGYGHVTPVSRLGKIVCMLYAIIGIPLTLILLSATIDRLLTPINWLLWKMTSKLIDLFQPFTIRILHLFIIVSFVTGIFIVIPTIILVHLEPEWEILDCVYYCFISLTTIGLGDYIPGDNINQVERSIYKVSTAIYLIFGIIGIMVTVTVFNQIPKLNMGRFFSNNDISVHDEPIKFEDNRQKQYFCLI